MRPTRFPTVALALSLALAPGLARAGLLDDAPSAERLARAREAYHRALVADQLIALGTDRPEAEATAALWTAEEVAYLAAHPGALDPAAGILVPDGQKSADTWKSIGLMVVAYAALVGGAIALRDAIDPP
ncbi:MAG: hypothetical protein HY722_03575 [Planctomycetes bacterium]|nr:hypothetical protein [Planctomycetota bacterium]